MIETEQATLPSQNSLNEMEKVISSNSIIKYLEYDNSNESLVITSIFDGEDPAKEVFRVEEESKNKKGFLSKKESQIVEFCTFRPNNHIAGALLGCKKDDEIRISINGMFFSCRILDFFDSQKS